MSVFPLNKLMKKLLKINQTQWPSAGHAKALLAQKTTRRFSGESLRAVFVRSRIISAAIAHENCTAAGVKHCKRYLSFMCPGFLRPADMDDYLRFFFLR